VYRLVCSSMLPTKLALLQLINSSRKSMANSTVRGTGLSGNSARWLIVFSSCEQVRWSILPDDQQLRYLSSAGQVGPTSDFLNEPDSKEHADPETLGKSLFDNESPEAWGSLFTINTAAPFFVTTRFLGLLAKGSADVPTWTSSVINITSISGIVKLAQRHVRLVDVMNHFYWLSHPW
jgi:NAD(P)-dependent dehydrogenase (short-subunit alcohol dehydrogenase family)